MFINVYKNKVLQGKIRKTTIEKNGKKYTKLHTFYL